MRFLLLCLLVGCNITAVPTPTVASGSWDSAHGDLAHEYDYTLAYEGEHLVFERAEDLAGHLQYLYTTSYDGDLLVEEKYAAADPNASYDTTATLAGDRIASRRHVEIGHDYTETLEYDGAHVAKQTRAFDAGGAPAITSYIYGFSDEKITATTCTGALCDRAVYEQGVGTPTTVDGTTDHFDQLQLDRDNDGTFDVETDRTYDPVTQQLVSETERDLRTHAVVREDITTRNVDGSLATWSTTEPDGIGGRRTYTITYGYPGVGQ